VNGSLKVSSLELNYLLSPIPDTNLPNTPISTSISSSATGRWISRRRYAIERALEIVGEAARRVSPGINSAHPEIPWKGIIGFRNVLAREYGEIDYRRLFTVVNEGVPARFQATRQGARRSVNQCDSSSRR